MNLYSYMLRQTEIRLEILRANLEGYVRSPARRFVGHRRRPHISRIERRRGPVSRYGESAERLLIVDPRGAVCESGGSDRRTVLPFGRWRLDGSDGSDDDGVEAEASGRRANEALNLGAGGELARRARKSKAIEIRSAFVIMMCRSERRRICRARWARCGA